MLSLGCQHSVFCQKSSNVEMKKGKCSFPLPKHMKPYEGIGGKLSYIFILSKVKVRVTFMVWTTVLDEIASPVK